MKLLLLTLAFLTLEVIANPIHKQSVYFKQGKVKYINAFGPQSSDRIQYFKDKNNTKATFEHNILLDGEMLKAAQYKNKIVVILEYTTSTHHVIIFDSINGNIVDSFWSVFSSISPNGRFVVFERWYSKADVAKPGFPPGITLIYDVSKSPRENRNQMAQASFENKKISISEAHDDVGIPIYPVADFNQQSYYDFVDKKEKNVGVHGTYYWYKEDSFIFNTRPYSNKTMLIDASFKLKKKAFVVKTKWLSTKDLSENNPPNAPDMYIKKIEKFGDTIKLYLRQSIVFLEDFAK